METTYAVPRIVENTEPVRPRWWLLVEPEEENARRLVQALEDFGFGGLGLVLDDFTTPGRIVQLGYPPNRIDLLTSLAGLDFAAAWEARVEGLYGDQPVSSAPPGSTAPRPAGTSRPRRSGR